MPAVVIVLSEDGQLSVGEIDQSIVPSEELAPVESLDDAVSAAETLLFGEEAGESTENESFEKSLGVKDGDESYGV